MKKLQKTQTLYAIAIVLTLTVAAFAVDMQAVVAHTPPWTIPTFCYVSVAPKTIGVSQNVLVLVWLHNVPPTGSGAYGDRWEGLKITITKPDGSKIVKGPYTSDPVGAAWLTFVPTEPGIYTFQGSFPGQVIAGKNLNPNDQTGREFINDTFSASTSEIATLIVQQEPTPTYQDTPWPTDYWTRPISGEHRNWWIFSGNYLVAPGSGGSTAGRYDLSYSPYSNAPGSAHILWAKPITFGGLVGGEFGATSWHDGGAYEGKWTPPIIINGVLYYNKYPIDTYNRYTLNGFYAVDLRTGEELWYNNDSRLAFGQIYRYDSPNQHGAFAYLWAISGTTWKAYDAFTGDWVYTMTNVPSGSTATGPDGSILRYQLNTAGDWLALWNSSANVALQGGPTGTDAWQWRPVGKTVDARNSYSWNFSIPADITGSINFVLSDRIIGSSGLSAFTGTRMYLPTANASIWAISTKPGQQGQLLWKKTINSESGVTLDIGSVSEADKIFTLKSFQSRSHWAYSTDTGDMVWGPTISQDSWDMFLHMTTGIAFGKLFSVGYSGTVYAYDVKNGALLWTYNATDPTFEALHSGNYPLYFMSAAEGKLYVVAGEHSPDNPKPRGSLMYCLDAETGEELWTIPFYRPSWASGAAIADGIMVSLSTLDNVIYAFGKGQTKTTVSASPAITTQGSSVMITGTVMDQSPGAKDTPAIADENMTAWMKHLYMQFPLPENIVGVPVKLTTIDPNGNNVDIATVNSDMSGMFYCKWKPELEGAYKIIATFEGSESYWSSYSETALGIDAAPSPVSTQTAPPASTPPPATSAPPTTTPPTAVPNPTENTLTMVYVAVAAVVVIVVIIAAALLLRRRK